MTYHPFKEFPCSGEPGKCPDDDPGVDWLARATRERLLASRDARALRQRAYTRAQVRVLIDRRARRCARFGGTQQTF